MILEKMRQHAWKILFLSTGTLLIVIGASANRQKKLERESANLTTLVQERANSQANELLLAQASELQANAQAVQSAIAAERQQKMDTLVNNPATVTEQETVPVTTVIPGATRKVTVDVAASSSSKTTTSKSTTSTPAKSTKTS